MEVEGEVCNYPKSWDNSTYNKDIVKQKSHVAIQNASANEGKTCMNETPKYEINRPERSSKMALNSQHQGKGNLQGTPLRSFDELQSITDDLNQIPVEEEGF